MSFLKSWWACFKKIHWMFIQNKSYIFHFLMLMCSGSSEIRKQDSKDKGHATLWMQRSDLCLETLLSTCHLSFKPEGSLSSAPMAGSSGSFDITLVWVQTQNWNGAQNSLPAGLSSDCWCDVLHVRTLALLLGRTRGGISVSSARGLVKANRKSLERLQPVVAQCEECFLDP